MARTAENLLFGKIQWGNKTVLKAQKTDGI
jgi:hypothetical protein